MQIFAILIIVFFVILIARGHGQHEEIDSTNIDKYSDIGQG